jgi:hypothetical protein
MRRRRPAPFEGAFMVPKHSRLERMAWIERSLQLATIANLSSVERLAEYHISYHVML